MSKDYQQIAKEKSKDELVRILVNREEYKDELVEAATQELKAREKAGINEELNEGVQSKVPPSIQPFMHEPKETPFGIYLAGILFFITSPFWIFISTLQAGASLFIDDSLITFTSIWNFFAAVLSIVFGIGIIKAKPWGYDWGLGTAIISIPWFSYLYMQKESMPLLFLIVIDVVILIALLSNKKYFVREVTSQLNFSVNVPASLLGESGSAQQLDEKAYKELVIKLNTLIKEGKSSLFGNVNGDEIKHIINELCLDKSSALYLLNIYQNVFYADLIGELKELTSSYEGIKEFLEVFINNKIVADQYPHARLT